MRIILFLLLSLSLGITAQNVENINVPGDELPVYTGGSMAYDIIYDNVSGKMFVYSSDKILVYNAASHECLGEIPFGEYGKFNPVYFNPRLHVVDIKLMAINNDGSNKLLYIITPNLHILAIDINDISQTWDITPYVDEASTTTLEDLFQSQNGKVIIRYNNNDNGTPNHNYLYMLVAGKNDYYGTGNFHSRTSFFGIYDVDNDIQPNNTDYINLYYSEIIDENGVYTDQINDFVFNTVPGNDFYYLTRLGNPDGVIQVWEITPGIPNQKVNIITTIYVPTASGYYKFGKMLNINNSVLHKIIVFPYRYPSSTVETPKFCVIDGNHTNLPNSVQYQLVDSPSKRILDATYLEGNNDLILCYAPIDEEIVNTNNYNTDIAVFNYVNGDFVPGVPFAFNTDNSLVTSNEYDVNYSLKLLKTDPNTVLINKKDEIVKFQHNGFAYEHTPLLSGESNFFMNGATGSGSAFVINTVANGIEIFNSDYTNETIRTGYPVYHITANNDGNKQYLFNKLNGYGTGLYVYADEIVVNINDQQSTSEKGIETAIGDCVYNSFTNHFLVSENSDFGTGNSAKIKVYNDDQNNSWHSTIFLPDNVQFARTMFVAPNERLYIMADMHNGSIPKIFIYNAIDYTPLTSYEINIPSQDAFDFYSGYFCYNPHNQIVYASIHPTEITLDPYHTVPNSMFDFWEPVETENTGFFIKIENTQITLFDLNYPGKIICPDIGSKDSVSKYDGKMFIIGKEFNEFDYLTDEVESTSNPFNDITYSAAHDQLFAIRDVQNDILDDRECEIWSIDYADNNILFSPYGSFAGQASSIFSNPYDSKVYIYNKIDDAKLGGAESKLYFFDPDIGFFNNAIDLGITSYYPELDHGPDYHYYFYNITTPYINPYTNHVYLPNGGHSSISKVGLTFVDELSLNPGINWISIPRHNRSTDPDWTLIADVFHQDNFTEGYSTFDLLYLNAEPTPVIYYNADWFINWAYNPNINDVKRTFSTRGYKLDLSQPVTDNTLIMTGIMQDPATPIELYSGKDNWVGYFLHQQQDIFDALGIVAHYLVKIEAENWCCVYEGHYRNPNNPQLAGEGWVCNDRVHNIDFGEMVVLSTNYLEPGYTFAWQGRGQPIIGEPRAETDNFTFTETADYTPIFILLDSTDNPTELATFVNDSCVGACIVLPDDTLVGIQAYIVGQPGDSITFEAWYNTKSTARQKINAYSVYNPDKKQYEQKSIIIGENRDFYQVSFRKHDFDSYRDDDAGGKNIFGFWVYPNPAHGNLHIEYILQKESNVLLEVHDIFGRNIALIMQGTQPQGLQNLNWDVTGNAGQRLRTGMYTIKLSAGGETITKKVMIN